MKYSVLILLLLVMGYVPVLAQSAEEKVLQATDVEKLQQLSNQFDKKYKADKQAAVQAAKKNNWPIRVDYKDGKTIELMALDENGLPMYLETTNKTAAKSTNTDVLHSGGGLGYNLEGQGMIVGEWDAGAVRPNHIEMVGRVTQVDGATSTHDHAQHVGGTMIASGVDPSAKGMAPQAHLWAHDWGNDASEMAAAAANGLLISQHSYGWITGWHQDSDNGDWYWYGDPNLHPSEDYNFGRYDGRARSWDQIAYNAPYYLICKSAGNDRGDHFSGSHYVRNGGGWTLVSSPREKDGGYDGYDCIGHNGNSKNILSIGATYDVPNYTNAGSVPITSFSSWGPTDDGRIKPDLVGNGAYVYSTSHVSDTTYSTKSGTSMSGPNVAGSLVLIQQRYRDLYNQFMLSATLRGLAIHTCREAGPAEGPDYIHGWGLLNTAAAVQLLTDEKAVVEETSIANNQTINKVFYHDGLSSIRATICWTDIPSNTVPASINNPQLTLVNDLDVRLLDPQGNVYSPYILDPANPSAPAQRGDNFRDNVEQIYQQGTSEGYYTLQITHKGTLSGPQDLSIILEGKAEPPTACLNLDSIWSESYASTFSASQVITSDSLGNFYVAGRFNGTLQAGSFSINSNGNQEIFVAKYDVNRTPLWLKKITGDDNNTLTAITVDDQLNCYISGRYYNNIDIQGTSYSNTNQLHSFVTKWDANGNIVWAEELTGTGFNAITDLSISNNQLYACGFFENSLSINTNTLNNTGVDKDSYLAAFDMNGTTQWLRQYGGTADDAFETMTTDENNNIWIGGYYRNSATYDTFSVNGINQNAVLVQFTSSGAINNVLEMTGDSSETVRQVLADHQGYIYAICDYYDNISINQQVSQAYANRDVAIVKYNLNGQYDWQQHIRSQNIVNIGQSAFLYHQLYLPLHYVDSVWVGDSTIHASTDVQAGLLLINKTKGLNAFYSIGNNTANDGAWALTTNNKQLVLTGTAGDNFTLLGQATTAGMPSSDMWISQWNLDELPTINLGMDQIVQCVDTVQLSATVDGSSAFQWTPTTGLSDSTILNPNFVITQTSIYQLSASNSCGDKTIDNIIVHVDDTAGMSLILPSDTTINCGDSLAVFPMASGPGTLSYQWLPAIGMNKSDTLYPLIAPPLQNLGYTLTMSNECGGQVSDDLRITTIPPTITASISPDTSISCGDSIRLETMATGYSPIQYNWIPNTGLANPQASSTMASPSSTTNYTLQIIAGCNTAEIRTVEVQVDAINLPNIMQKNDTLVAPILANSYQWFMNGQAILGATNDTLVVVDSADYSYTIVDTNNCDGMSNPVTYMPPVSVFQIDNESIRLYPNPNSGQFTLDLGDATADRMQVFDARGREVHQSIITNQIVPVHLPKLPSGTYWIKITDKTNTYVLPFIKK